MSRPIHEVKPLQARLVRSWETRLEVRVLSVHVPTAALAQLGERQTEDLKVPGSIPGGGRRMRGAMAARRIPDPKVAGSIPVVFTMQCGHPI